MPVSFAEVRPAALHLDCSSQLPVMSPLSYLSASTRTLAAIGSFWTSQNQLEETVLAQRHGIDAPELIRRNRPSRSYTL